MMYPDTCRLSIGISNKKAAHVNSVETDTS